MASQGLPRARGSGRPDWAGGGGTIANGMSCKGTKYTAAARTSPMGARWRGRRRTPIALGEGGPERWEVERRPA